MKTPMKEKPRIVPVTEEAEIVSVESNGMRDIIGSRDKSGHYWAYAHSLERWRKSRDREEGKP